MFAKMHCACSKSCHVAFRLAGVTEKGDEMVKCLHAARLRAATQPVATAQADDIVCSSMPQRSVQMCIIAMLRAQRQAAAAGQKTNIPETKRPPHLFPVHALQRQVGVSRGVHVGDAALQWQAAAALLNEPT